ncbi:hypothetical protein EJB05_54908, partial [Eragrostis curvula]
MVFGGPVQLHRLHRPRAGPGDGALRGGGAAGASSRGGGRGQRAAGRGEGSTRPVLLFFNSFFPGRPPWPSGARTRLPPPSVAPRLKTTPPEDAQGHTPANPHLQFQPPSPTARWTGVFLHGRRWSKLDLVINSVFHDRRNQVFPRRLLHERHRRTSGAAWAGEKKLQQQATGREASTGARGTDGLWCRGRLRRRARRSDARSGSNAGAGAPCLHRIRHLLDAPVRVG